MKCKSFLNIDRSSGISSMPRAVRSQKDQRQEVRITRLGDHKTRWSCDYNSPPPHVIPAAWLRCKYEKSVIRKSTRICPFNAKNRPDYSTASERLLEENRKYTKQPILLPSHCNQVDHKSLIGKGIILLYLCKRSKMSNLLKRKIWMREPLSLVECPSWRPAATPKSLCCENKGRVQFASPPLIHICWIGGRGLDGVSNWKLIQLIRIIKYIFYCEVVWHNLRYHHHRSN